MRTNGVRCLLMGGQACVFYGAAEFSRDLDLTIRADDENLARLASAFQGLEARPIAVPDLSLQVLARGHAAHFRCYRPDVEGLWIDVMGRMRGAAPFDVLWERRTTIEVQGEPVDLLSLPDLVIAKKTQRDKDWPMIRRLVERSALSGAEAADPDAVRFWLEELRTPELLLDLAKRFPDLASQCSRKAVQAALAESRELIEAELRSEESTEREADRAYWEPLRRELEQMRRERGLRPA